MTLEDETGFVNLVVWQRVFEQHRALLKTTSFLGVTGRVQSEDGVVHLLVENPWVPGVSRSPRPVTSRDFH
jgi:error-prone DNA polymerase